MAFMHLLPLARLRCSKPGFPVVIITRSDPIRPFISGHVANSMAAEVIALLHSLLTAPESNTAQIWTSTAEKVTQTHTTLLQFSDFFKLYSNKPVMEQ